MDDYTLLHGDCLEVMAAMDAGSVDAVCCDPPYGLEFMGKKWDKLGLWATRDKSEDLTGKSSSPFLAAAVNKYKSGVEGQLWHQAWATEALRVLKPSHYLLAFGGTRTWHRLACAIEDAGFEIRDTLMWLYGSGFPKGKSCLKPAWEPIILARKPGPMRELGIDSCRIGTDDVLTGSGSPPLKYGGTNHRPFHDHAEPLGCNQHPSGRWPANLILECTCDETREGTAKTPKPYVPSVVRSGMFGKGGVGHDREYGDESGKEPVRIHTDPNCPCAMLDGQTGTKTSGSRVAGVRKGLGYHGADGDGGPAIVGDSGGASRFFYAPKASRAERGEGNTHPTVKPLALMRWLVKLVAQPGDVVLDPFMGSGTTGVACAMEGREFVGVEQDAGYLEISRRRIEAASAQVRLPVWAVT